MQFKYGELSIRHPAQDEGQVKRVLPTATYFIFPVCLNATFSQTFWLMLKDWSQTPPMGIR